MNDIIHRTRVALALDRTPGFNYSCNLLGVRFPVQTPAHIEVHMDHGAYCEDATGHVDPGAASLLADVAMGCVVRANLPPDQRLGTVSLQLQFTGLPLLGPLVAEGGFTRFIDGADSRQGLCTCRVLTPHGPAILGQGAFMVMSPPPGRTMHPVVDAIHVGAPPLADAEMGAHEAELMARTRRALQATNGERGFLQHFWGIHPERMADGAECRVENGPHLGNRVGHMQGGLQTGLALATAGAALPPHWTVSAISAWFLRPGEGPSIEARARVDHRGRNTAIVRTTLINTEGQRVLEAVSTHLRGTRQNTEAE